MSTAYVLYNPHAGVGEDTESIKHASVFENTVTELINITEITDYESFLSRISNDDILVIAGGDGTLNRFINDTEGIEFAGKILYYPNGSGNDFARDMGCAKNGEPFPVNEYIKHLPCVTVKGKKYCFINGVGYGIDGYCCEVGDKIKATSDKPVNYTGIAIKGLLFHYKPTDAEVTVDGVTHTYKKVWLAPTMFGRYYGGGMMPAPLQSREKDSLSVMVLHGSGKLKTLMIFPSIFKGEHIKHDKYVEVIEGKEITVEFNRPTPLQIDGETILGVTSYTAVI